MASQFLAEINKIPPVTRFLSISTLAVTVPVLLKVLNPYKILFVDKLVLHGEIWRVPSSFFFAGTGLTFLFDLIMLFRNSSALETTHYGGRSQDYAWHLLMAAGAILGLNIPFGSFFHFRPLLVSVVYLSSALNPGQQVSLMGLLNVPAQYFPYVMVALDGIMAGPMDAARALTGLLVGHAWWMLDQRRALPPAPGVVKAVVGDGAVQAGQDAAAPGRSGVVNPGRAEGVRFGGSGAVNRPPRGPAPAARTTVTGGYNWGSGQRLGE